MKTTILKLIVSGAMLIGLGSCETLTFGGKTVVKIKNDVVYQTIRRPATEFRNRQAPGVLTRLSLIIDN